MEPRREIIDLLDCGPTAAAISEAIYKGTNCGAWIKFETADLVAVGDIVENGGRMVGPYRLEWPFTGAEFWALVQQVDDEAGEIWQENEAYNEEDDA